MSEKASRHDRIADLFVQASKLPNDARQCFLERECAQDPEIVREVESLLVASDRGVPVFDAPESHSVLGKMARESGQSLLGERIDHYQITRLIATGGMGTVYEAIQQNPRRSVAIKVLRGSLVTRSALQRFEFESELLGRLHHPGIAQVYGAGVHDGVPYFAMEYIPNARAITQFAGEQELSVRSRLQLFTGVCDAVQHGHQQGVIHRDLKPDNILVDVSGHVKVIDFGVARATDDELRLTMQHTGAGQMLGTLAYMSPEQVLGDSRQVDTRSDVFALGVVLYELLAGRPPLDVGRSGIPEAARLIREAEPQRLSSIDPALRGDLETIVAKSLSKEKHRRYQSAGELAADIQRFLNDEPIVARPPTALYQLRKFAQRHKGLVGGGLLGGAALITALLVAIRAAIVAREHDAASQRQTYIASVNAACAALGDHDVMLAKRSLSSAPAHLRRWEWQHLMSRLDESLTVIALDDVPPMVGPLRFADGNRVLECGLRGGGSIRWDPWSGVRLGVTERPFPTAISPGGTFEVTQSETEVSVREVATGSVHSNRWVDLGAPDGLKSSLQVADDGRYICFERGAQVWSVDLEERTTRDVRYPDGLMGYCLAVQGNDHRIALATGANGRPGIWDPASGVITPFNGVVECGYSVDFSPDSRRVVVGLMDTTLRLCDATSYQAVAVERGHSDVVAKVKYCSDGKLIASSGRDRTVRLWSADTLAPRGAYHGHESPASTLVFTSDASLLASWSGDRTIRVWDLSREGDAGLFAGHESFVYAVAPSPDGSLIASAGWDGFAGKPGALRVWDAATGDPIARWGQSDESAMTVSFSPDGSYLAAGTTTGAWVWNAKTGELLVTRATSYVNRVEFLAWDPTSRRLASNSLDATARVWLATTGAEIATFPAGRAVTWSPDGKWLVSFDSVGDIELRDATSFAVRRHLPGDHSGYWQVMFSPDGSRLAATSADNTVKIWDVESGTPLASLPSSDEVLCIAFSKDGSRIATGGRDQVIRLWDGQSLDEIATLRGHQSYVKSLAFSRDGSFLVSGSGDHTVRIWDTHPVRDRLRARRERAAILAEAEPLVDRLFTELSEPALVVNALCGDSKLTHRAREVALQLVLKRGLERSR